MRLVYLGSPDAAVEPLRALVEAGHDVALVVTRADKRRGRGAAVLPSAVKAAANGLGLPVTDQPDDILRLEPPAELGVVVAYGRLIKPHLLGALPFVNLHFSLLPRWRGAAPVERAILAGDDVTGVCLMALEEGLDTGPVYRRVVTPIEPGETSETLRARLVDLATPMLVEALAHGLGTAEQQEGDPTYAAKIEPQEHELHWSAPAEAIERTVRLGRAWTTFRGKRLKILRTQTIVGATDAGRLEPGQIDGLLVATATQSVELVDVQPEGKAPMAATAWRNGVQPKQGERLGSADVTGSVDATESTGA